MISLRKFNSYMLFFTWLCTTVLLLMSVNRNIVYFLWLLLLFAAIIQVKKINFRITYKDNITVIWMVLLLYMTCMTLINYLLGDNYLRSVYHCIVGFWLPFFAVKLLSKKCNIETILQLYRGFVLVCCVAGIVEYVLKIQPYSILITDSYAVNNFYTYGSVRNSIYPYRTTLIFYHPIFYSIFLSCGLAFFLYKPFRRKTLNILSTVLLLCNLILTRSRTGWISACVVILLYILDRNRCKMTKKKFLSFFKIISGFILFTLMILWLSPEMIHNLVGIIIERVLQVLEGEAGGARIANLALISLSMRSRNIIGVILGGGRNYASMLLRNNAQVDGWINAVDNQYLTFFLDYGIIGLVLLMVFYYKAFRMFWNSHNVNCSLMLCIIVSFAFNSLFFEFFNMNTIYYLFLICVIFSDYVGNVDDIRMKVS